MMVRKLPGRSDNGVGCGYIKGNETSRAGCFIFYHDDDTTISPNTRSKADAIISKPIDHDQLHKAITDALAKTET